MKHKFQLMLPPVVMGLWLLAGCEKPREGLDQASRLPVATVRTMLVTRGLRMASEDVVGTVRPKLSAVVSAKVSGAMQRMTATPGQVVKAGDWLAQIDAREIQARLDQAQATREQARKDVDRLTKLLNDKVITQQEFDAVDARFRVADATVKEAESTVGYMRITAPFDGVITRKFADVGDLAVPGKPLFEIEDPSALRLEADVPEAAIDQLKLGAQLPVRLAALTNELTGTISELSPAADPASRTSMVKLDLPGVPGLRSGQFGRVAVPLAEVQAIQVPAAAIMTRGQMEIAFVVTNQHAQMRLVKTGKNLGRQVELVSGLEAGETLVTEGASSLADGQPVQTRQ